MKVRGVDFVLFFVTDLERSLRFYCDLLGLPLEFYNDEWKWAELSAGNLTVTLCGEGASEPRGSGGILALAVKDLAKVSEEIRAAGVSISKELHELATCWHLEILDPDGYTIILHERKDGSYG